MAVGDAELRARLQAIFLEELDEHLERLERGLESLAGAAAEPSEGLVDELFRSAHSLKGAAASVGASDVAALCHQLEDTLSTLREQGIEPERELVAGMVGVVDRLASAGAALRAAAAPRGQDASSPASTPRPPAQAAEGGEQRGRERGRPADPSARSTRTGRDSSTVRVTGDRLDTLLSQAGDLITSTYRLEQLVIGCVDLSTRLHTEAEQWRTERARLERTMGPVLAEHPALREVLDRVDGGWRRTSIALDRLAHSASAQQGTLRGVATGFAESVRQVRMVPFTEATGGLARTVRDVCAEQGKQARLVVDAAEVEVDKQLVGTLHDVLGHAVRNAVVHGIEPPQQRVRAGKPAEGDVAVRAVLHSDGILVTVADDGRGIDTAAVAERAAALGLDAGGDGEVDLTEALFHPGLTTAEEVTESSGRGVGLDAVRAAVDATGGSVSFDSTPGEGSRLSVRVPLTLSMLRVLLVRVAGEVVGLPTSAVQRLVRVPAEPARLAGRDVVEVGDALVPVVPLAQLLGWDTGPTAREESAGILVTAADGSVVLVADDVLAEREVVLRVGSSRLRGLKLLLGTTQMEDGAVSLVLSPAVCVRAALEGATDSTGAASEERDQPARVLLVEDTVTTRELERSILVGAGYDVVVAVDGQQGWEMLQAREFDAVVSDVNMPRMDGIALCRAIRGSRHHADLPVVLVTSLHSEADRRRGLDAGADAYLTKQGFDRAELVATLERLL